jgi:hypothetical protein
MRITISHNRSKAGMIASIDRSFDQLLRGEADLPISLAVTEKSWKGSILSFMLRAKMGLLSTPIKGTVEVTDHDIIVDADLGLVNLILPENAVREVLGERIKGLLN